MWHEARKQERKIRGMIVDFRKRAERRQDFYEKIKADPTQFMQVHGRKCKIHLDSAIAAAGDGSAIIVPWQGQKDNLIDRFDVRAHLDYIPPIQKTNENDELTVEERQCNYERYRILAQNDFLNITEDKFLHQLYLEEQFGANAPTEISNQMIGGASNNSNNKKKPSVGSGAAIGYNYEDNDSSSAPFSHILSAPTINVAQAPKLEDEDSESDLDMDVSIEITKLDTSQAHELNGCGRNYGMLGNDFFSYLHKDADEAEALRMAREEEAEKIMLSGRKSRRERRAQRERRFIGRPLSPPSYAAKEEPQEKENESVDSRSPSPENSGKITYITSFGGEDEMQPHSKISINLNKPLGSNSNMSYADKVKENLSKLKEINEMQKRQKSPDSPKVPKQYLRSRTRSRSRSYKRKSRSRSNYKRSISRNYRRTRSRDRNCRNRRRRTSSSSDSRNSSIRRKSRSRSYYRRRERDYSRSRSPRNLKNFRYQTNRKRRSPSTYSDTSKSKSPERSKSISKTKTTPTTNIAEDNPQINIEKPFSFGECIVPSNSAFNPSEIYNLPPVGNVGQLPKLPIITSQLPQAITFNKPTLSPIRPQQSPKPLQFISQNNNSPKDPEIPIKRYYGRRKDDESSSNSDDDNTTEEETDNNKNLNENSNSNPFPATSVVGSSGNSGAGNSGTIITNSSTYDVKVQGKINPRDRLKRKMQILLNKQYKADKKAEIERTERQIQQQQEREDEMRELALKLRRRQRELRHKYGTPSPIGNSSDSESEKQPTIISISAAPVINKDALKLIKEKSKSKSKSRSRTPRDKERRRRSQEKTNESRKRSSSRNRTACHSGREIGNNSSSYNRRRRSNSNTDYKKNSKRRSRSSSRHRPQQPPHSGGNSNRYRQRSRSRDRRTTTSSYRDRDRDRNRYNNDRRRDEQQQQRNYNYSRNYRSRSRSYDRSYNRRQRDRSRDNDNNNRQKDRNNDNNKNNSSSGNNNSSPKVFSSTRRLVDY